MRAVVVEKYGSPEGLRIKEVETPIPKDNELLVKIHATTVTYGDAALRRMRFPVRMVFGLFMGGLGKNKIMGHEFAGEVEAIGSDVISFKSGDQVFGSTGLKGGAHAEYICLPQDSMMTIKPKIMTFEEAAAVPIGGNTAYDILRRANILEEQKVLIYGASGSVGSYAVQLAKHWGAEVTGVSTNLDLVEELGADHAINYKIEDFTERGISYDVIFDAVRKLSSSHARRTLTESGTFLSVGSPTKESVENLLFLKELIEARSLKPVIDRTYPLEEIVEAHRYVDTGRKKGNVVITLNQI